MAEKSAIEQVLESMNKDLALEAELNMRIDEVIHKYKGNDGQELADSIKLAALELLYPKVNQ